MAKKRKKTRGAKKATKKKKKTSKKKKTTKKAAKKKTAKKKKAAKKASKKKKKTAKKAKKAKKAKGKKKTKAKKAAKGKKKSSGSKKKTSKPGPVLTPVDSGLSNFPSTGKPAPMGESNYDDLDEGNDLETADDESREIQRYAQDEDRSDDDFPFRSNDEE